MATRSWLVLVPFLLGLASCEAVGTLAEGVTSVRYLSMRIREVPPAAGGMYDPDLHYDAYICDHLESSAAVRDHSVIGDVYESVIYDWLEELWDYPDFDPEGLPTNAQFWAYEPTFVESAAHVCRFEPDDDPEIELFHAPGAALGGNTVDGSLELEIDDIGVPDMPSSILITIPGPISVGQTIELPDAGVVVFFGSSAATSSGTVTLLRFELANIDIANEVATGRFQLVIDADDSDTLFVVPAAEFQLEIDFHETN